MGKKKSGPKKAKAAAEPTGDLRNIERFVELFKAGDMTGAEGLMDLGKDAAFTVLALGEAQQDEELLAFGKKLVAVRPQFPTNLFELRRQSVLALIKAHKAEAPPIETVGGLSVGPAVALFDPLRVAPDLAKSGRPRRDAPRIEAGDIAWFGLPATESKLEVHLAPPPGPLWEISKDGTGPILRLRLKVESGLVFLGAPEAADGPRLGTVRLDPFHTGLDEQLAKGRLARLKPGTYAMYAYLSGLHHVRVHLVPETDPKAAIHLVEATQRGLKPPEVLASP